MIDLVGIASAVGSSGATVLLYNFWTSKRLEKTAKNADRRNERREPYILQSLELGNVARVNELLQHGLDEVEESKKRQASEFREVKTLLEDKISSLINENERLIVEHTTEKKKTEEKVHELQTELINLHFDLRKLKESGSAS